MQRSLKTGAGLVLLFHIISSYCEDSAGTLHPRMLPPSLIPMRSQEVDTKQTAVQEISSGTYVGTGTGVNVQNVSGAVAEEEEVLRIAGEMYLKQNKVPLRICKDRDSELLNQCLRGVFEDIKPRLAEGIPEVGLPGIDPLRIPFLSFEHGNGPVRILAKFTELEITGLSTFNKSEFWVDVSKRRLVFDVTFPHLLLAGTYQLSGNLFFVPISGVGNFWLNLGGVSSKGSGDLISFTTTSSDANGTHNHRRVILEKTQLQLNIDSIKTHLTNLFNGDRLLGSVVNNFLNENSQDIFEELRPQIGAQVGEMLTMIANRALSALPADYFDTMNVSSIPESLTNTNKPLLTK